MKIQTLIRYSLIILALQFFYKNLVDAFPSYIEEANGTINASTTVGIQANDKSDQYLNDLTLSDLKNILEILLLMVKKQPDVSSLKLLDRLINNMITQKTDAQTHQQLVRNLQADDEIRSLLGGININSGTTPPMEFVEELKLLLGNNQNDTNTKKSLKELVNLSKLITSRVENEEGPITTSSTLTELGYRIYNNESSENPAPVHGDLPIISFSPNNTLRTVLNASSAFMNSKITTESAITSSPLPRNETYKIRKWLNGVPQLIKRTKTQFFPVLSEPLLTLINKFNLKFVRTYSEILEPFSVKDTNIKHTETTMEEKFVENSDSNESKEAMLDDSNEQTVRVKRSAKLQSPRWTALNLSNIDKENYCTAKTTTQSKQRPFQLMNNSTTKGRKSSANFRNKNNITLRGVISKAAGTTPVSVAHPITRKIRVFQRLSKLNAHSKDHRNNTHQQLATKIGKRKQPLIQRSKGRKPKSPASTVATTASSMIGKQKLKGSAPPFSITTRKPLRPPGRRSSIIQRSKGRKPKSTVSTVATIDSSMIGKQKLKGGTPTLAITTRKPLRPPGRNSKITRKPRRSPGRNTISSSKNKQ